MLNERIRHSAKVGSPLCEPANIPALPNQHDKESGTNPLDCILILESPDGFGSLEYRIGRFKDKNDLEAGLTRADSKNGFTQNPETTRRVFGGSQIYRKRKSAVIAALQTYPANSGIKVLRRSRRYPFSEEVLNAET